MEENTDEMIKADRAISEVSLKNSVLAAMEALITQQHNDGRWSYGMECFVFIPAFHILTLHYTGDFPDTEISIRIGNYFRRNQLSSGGWGLVPNSSCMDLNASVVTYLALRLLGDGAGEEHMIRSRNAILENGGIEATNFNVRNYLALFDIVPWSSVPSVPVEIMLLPSWFPFTIYKVAFWARTTLVPITVLQALKRSAKNTTRVALDELFCENKAKIDLVQPSTDTSNRWFYPFKVADKILKFITPFIPPVIREKAIKTAVAFCTARLNGKDGFGSIGPPMQYCLMMFQALGYPSDHPDRLIAKEALKTFEVVQNDEAYITACLTPTWDTAHVINALLETGEPKAVAAVEKALEWIRPLQICDFKGDWAQQRPNIRPGGWAFFNKNPHYPDTDDTAYVLSGMHRMWRKRSSSADEEAISVGTNWLLGMQSENGGWASYDADNTYMYLNNIPFAYEDSLLDPPTVDVTGSVLLFLAQTCLKISNSESVRRGAEFVLANQEPNGSWWGRWGVAYIYGTMCAITSLVASGVPLDHLSILKGVAWLLSIQNKDGGWGESVDSYTHRTYMNGRSTASQTSWVLLALMAAMRLDNPAIELGIQYLMRWQNKDGQWDEEEYTGNGHPRVIYMRYHGYRKYLPLLALARFFKMRYKLVKHESDCSEFSG